MFDTLLVHPLSRAALDNFIAAPTHAVLLYGPDANGKSLIARELAALLLGCKPSELAKQPGLLEMLPDEKGKIGITAVRAVTAFMSLKTLGTGKIRRVVLVQEADTLTTPAQQALLKLVEEPPEDTALLFVTSLQHQLLPTILSRLRRVFIRRPYVNQLAGHLTERGANPEAIVAATAISGGSVGTALAYLGKTDSSSEDTMTQTRRIISLPLFDQLLLIDTELKESATAASFVTDLSRLAEISLHRTAGTKAASQWLNISSAAARASRYLQRKASTKLVLTELMLALRDTI